MQSRKMVLDRDEVDQLITLRMDLDKYETETIPNLHQRAALLGQALMEYGRHKSSCARSQQSSGTRCTCGFEAAVGNSRL
jgi:hypothetical protein